MARNLTAAQLAEITAQNLRPALFVSLAFTSGTVYLWSGVGSISWNGQTWLGVGDLGQVSPIGETSDVTAVSVKLSLSGIPADMVTHALGEVRQGAPVFIYQAFLTTAGGIVSSPNTAWSGRMDTCEISESGETAIISITAESRMLDLRRICPRRYENQDQTIDFIGDLGFSYVASLQEASVFWGVAAPTSAPIGGGGGGMGGGGNQGGGGSHGPAGGRGGAQ